MDGKGVDTERTRMKGGKTEVRRLRVRRLWAGKPRV
jgi:hypothetical protein